MKIYQIYYEEADYYSRPELLFSYLSKAKAELKLKELLRPCEKQFKDYQKYLSLSAKDKKKNDGYKRPSNFLQNFDPRDYWIEEIEIDEDMSEE